MMQIYLVAVFYLALGSGFLLSDRYGLKFALLLSLRYAFRTKKAFRTILILTGMLLTLALCFFPTDPGPVLLGDLIPMINVFALCVWYLYRALKGDRENKEEDESMLHATGQYFERNKRSFGYVTAIIAFLHFLAPALVLL